MNRPFKFFFNESTSLNHLVDLANYQVEEMMTGFIFWREFFSLICAA